MGELICSIRKFSFKGILVILAVFLLISAILFIELSGIRANRYDRVLDLMPKDRIVTKHDACKNLEKDTLVIHNSGDAASRIAYEQFDVMFTDMKVGHTAIDLANGTLPSFDTYSRIVVLLADLTPLGQKLSELCE